MQGLYVGSSSPLSAQDQLAAAAVTYNAKLALAQAGDLNAQGSITGDAQKYLDAAKAVFASSGGFQSIFQSVTSQLLSLPAVQSTTDPTVQAMRDVLTAINIGNAALSTANSNTTGLVLPAVNAGNAANVAAALAAYFNQIDPSGKLASVVANTGGLNSVTQNYLPAVYDTNYSNAGRLDTSNSLTQTSNATLDAIRGLQATAATQLTLLKSSLAPNVISIHVGATGNAPNPLPGGGSGHDYILQNQVVDALNKIAFNTYVLTQNTAYTDADNLKGHGGVGTYAAGGWITGGIPGVDSVRIFAQQKEYIVNPFATDRLTRDYGPGIMDMINSGRLPFNDRPSTRSISAAPNVMPFRNRNDNAELVAAFKDLQKEVEQLRRENNRGNDGIIATHREEASGIKKTIAGAGKATASATRDARRNPRAAATR